MSKFIWVQVQFRGSFFAYRVNLNAFYAKETVKIGVIDLNFKANIWCLKFPWVQVQFRDSSFAYKVNLDAFYAKKAKNKVKLV